MKLAAILEPREKAGFTVTVPALPGLHHWRPHPRRGAPEHPRCHRLVPGVSRRR